MGFHSSMIVWTYTLSASLAVLIINIQAPATWQSWATMAFGTVTTSPSLQGYLLDILFVGAAFTLGQIAVRRVRGEGMRRGRAEMVARGKG